MTPGLNELITFQDITTIILFILPGYLLLHTINIFTDYIFHKDTFDKIIGYIIFSIISYFCAFLHFLISFELGKLTINQWKLYNLNSAMQEFYYILVGLAFFYSILLGYFLGTKVFNKEHPIKFLKKHTNKIYTPSIYAKLWNDYKEGVWLTFHMKDNTIIQGKARRFSKNEEVKDYVFNIFDAKKYFLDEKESEMQLKGEDIVINLKDTYLIEYHN